MNVLVTGAFGFFGLPLLRRLVKEHVGVVAIGRPPRNPKAMALVPPGVHIVEGDILECGFPPDPVDVIVHLAGGGGPAEAAARPVEAVRAGVLGAVCIAKLAERRHIERVVFASSLYVYPPDAGACGEATPAGPETLYGVVKEIGERIAVAGGGVALRFGHIYGPTAVPPGSVVDRFAAAARAGRPIPLQGDGTRPMDLLYIDDAVEAIIAALWLNPRWCTPINVGGTVTTTGDLARWFAAAGNVVVEHDPAPGGVEPRRWLHSARARRVLDWTPACDLETGLRRTLGIP